MLHFSKWGERYYAVVVTMAKPAQSSTRAGTRLCLSKETPLIPLGRIILDKQMNKKPHKYPAVKARYPVTVLTAEGHVQGETRLINNRGALIRCQQPPSPHEAATISIDISEHETLIAEAEVVRLEFYELDSNDEISPRGMVVRFKNLSSIGRQRLRNIIAKHYVEKVKRLGAQH